MPTWICLADAPASSQLAPVESTSWQFESSWPWAPSVTVVLILLVVGWVFYFYARESGNASRIYRSLLALIRLAVMALLLFMLCQLVITRKRTGPPGIALLIDRSASMSISESYVAAGVTDEARAPTRLEQARSLLADDDALLLRKLLENYELSVYLFDQQVERERGDLKEVSKLVAELSAEGRESGQTRLGDAVGRALRDASGGALAAIIVLTDGVNTAGTTVGSAASLARRQGVPLMAVGIGSDQPPRDIQLADVLVEDAVFVDDLINFQVALKSTGLTGNPARLVLRREGDPNVLAEDTVQLNDDQAVLAQLTHRPSSEGSFTYVVEVSELEGEIAKDNNRSRHTVRVHAEKIRVLLVHAYPSYEFRYLKSLLGRDASVELSTYLQEADADYVRQEETAISAFPIGREATFEYDVLLLGDVNPQLLPRSVWPQIRALVEEQGGGVAFVAGPRYLPWLYRDNQDAAFLLPVNMSEDLAADADDQSEPGFTVRPTPLGLRTAALQLGDNREATRAIWQSLPPLYWLAVAGEAKLTAQVLAQHPTRTGPSGRPLPAISLQYVGNGRVLYHAIDSTWRWRQRTGDVFFARYWIQTMRFLARAKLAGRDGAQLTVERRNYQLGESVQLRLRFFDEALAPIAGESPQIVVEAAGQQKRRVALERDMAVNGVFRGTLTGLAAGDYRVLLIEPSLADDPPATQFAVTAPPGELARIRMDREALTTAAQMTHGKFYTMDTAHQLSEDLPAGRRVPLAMLPPWPLWNRPWVITLIVALLVTEWVLRRRKGML